jgi:hypothetical protein
MKQHIISVALGLACVGTAIAQVDVVTTPSTATATVSKGVNPFSGRSKEDDAKERELSSLQMQSLISTQKLKLQQDELNALKIEADKHKLLETINPPAPIKPKAEKISQKRPTAKALKNESPVEIISSPRERNALPDLVGIVESSGKMLGLVVYESRPMRVQEGSVIGGRIVGRITNTSLQWGTEFLRVSAKQGVPTVLITDEGHPKVLASGPIGAYVPTSNQGSQLLPRAMPVINSNGATISSVGSTNPSGIFGMPLPPPPNIGLR